MLYNKSTLNQEKSRPKWGAELEIAYYLYENFDKILEFETLWKIDF